MDSPVKQSGIKELWNSSTLAGGNASYLEQLYEMYLQDKNSVSDKWQHYFESLIQNDSYSDTVQADVSHEKIKKQFRHLEQLNKKNSATKFNR